MASSLIDRDTITKEVMLFFFCFFEEYQVQVKHLQDQCDKMIMNPIEKGKLKNPDI